MRLLRFKRGGTGPEIVPAASAVPESAYKRFGYGTGGPSNRVRPARANAPSPVGRAARDLGRGMIADIFGREVF
jgi:hypothetical protein